MGKMGRGHRVEVPVVRSRWLVGDVGPADIWRTLEGGEVIRGISKGRTGIHYIAGELMRRLGGPVEIWMATWVNSGDAIPLFLMWLEENAKSRVVLAFRGGAVDMAAGMGRQIQERYGPDSLRVSETHTEVCVLVGVGWYATIRTSQRIDNTQRFEQFDVDLREPVARMHLDWFGEMPTWGGNSLALNGGVAKVLVKVPREGYELHEISNGQSFVEHLTVLGGARCTVASNAMHDKQVGQVLAVFDSSRYLMSHDTGTLSNARVQSDRVKALAGDRMRTASSHMKWGVVEGERRWAVMTSANLNSPHRHETYVVTPDETTVEGLLDVYGEIERVGGRPDQGHGYYWETLQRAFAGRRRSMVEERSLAELVSEWEP